MPQLDRRNVTDLTRRTIFDALRVGKHFWAGKLDDAEFLSRIFDLNNLPSYDNRHKDMVGDIVRHRVMNEDWRDDWVFSDGRLGLLHVPDEVFLRFLCEMVHPVVRNEEEVDDLVATFNRNTVQIGAIGRGCRPVSCGNGSDVSSSCRSACRRASQ